MTPVLIYIPALTPTSWDSSLFLLCLLRHDSRWWTWLGVEGMKNRHTNTEKQQSGGLGSLVERPHSALYRLRVFFRYSWTGSWEYCALLSKILVLENYYYQLLSLIKKYRSVVNHLVYSNLGFRYVFKVKQRYNLDRKVIFKHFRDIQTMAFKIFLIT